MAKLRITACIVSCIILFAGCRASTSSENSKLAKAVSASTGKSTIAASSSAPAPAQPVVSSPKENTPAAAPTLQFEQGGVTGSSHSTVATSQNFSLEGSIDEVQW